MPREDFLANLRNSAVFLGVTAQPAGQPTDAGQLLKAAQGVRVWLAPRSVEGLDVADFPELSDSERRELEHEKNQFLKVARVAQDSRPTQPQVDDALSHFRRIVELTGRAFIAEWQRALDDLFANAEHWARSATGESSATQSRWTKASSAPTTYRRC